MSRQIYDHIVYFDTEACTDTSPHQCYCVSFALDDKPIQSYFRANCIKRFLDSLPDNTLAIAHNLSYDISFVINHLKSIYDNPIIKNGRVLQMKATYTHRVWKDNTWQDITTHITFKDSYAIISKPLRDFPSMFQLDAGRKEIYPYRYYNSINIQKIYGVIDEALECIASTDKDQFIANLQELNCINGELFDMCRYCVFYCEQDVRILKQGFEKFRELLLKEFDLDAYSFVSISSIANRYMELNCYFKNGNLYDLANTPRDFISRCIAGGRCMLSDNTKALNTSEPIVDFDAVSLYPSAIHRLYLLEGIPQVLQPKQLNTQYLLSHLFNEEQTEPTAKRFISGFFIEARIVKVGKPRHFPLIVWNHDINGLPEHERSTNDPCIMYLDHITFQDLITFQDCTIEPIRGYYSNDKRDYSIRGVIEHLFNLRLKYKAEDNPLQEIIKLMLNSIYGKTILKPINETYKFISTHGIYDYIRRRYNYIKEITGTDGVNQCIAKEIKPYNRHYSFVALGVMVLSMSKRIMNELITTAEDLNIPVYYQDTDSIHIHQSKLKSLADEFKRRYNRELIGEALGQFHSDFKTFGTSKDMPVAIRSVFCAKKMYCDQLMNSNNEIAFHIRLKGVVPDVIVDKANQMFPHDIQCYYDHGLVYPIDSVSDNNEYSVFHLYKALYDEEVIEFDLATSKIKPSFEIKDFQVRTRTSFIRRISISNQDFNFEET